MNITSPSAPSADTAPAASATICRQKMQMYLEPGNVTAECSEPEGHEGQHFDSAFGKYWGLGEAI